ncbi:luciferase family protein [Streptosporangium sp. NPDC087985]|uniref:luciferase domain-containing protein n=1 Tax=Streptosporangium sp. NPDC087985 TaxID=3366196 RepID=UPI0038194E68
MAVHAHTSDRSAEGVANVVAQLIRWPDLALKRTRRGLGFRAGGREIVRMSGGHTAELLLTTDVIDRWARVLTDCRRVTLGRDTGWVVMKIEGKTDADLFLSLVSVAIKVNQASRWPASRRSR